MFGRSKNNAGFTLIEAMVVIAVNAIIAAVAIPNLLHARRGANEASAISSLRTIVTAQAMFHEGGVRRYAQNLVTLGDSGLIDDTLASGEKSGYCFIVFSHDTAVGWHAHASPVLPGETGRRAFYVDETGVLRFSEGDPADPSSPSLADGADAVPSTSTDHRAGEPPPCNRRSLSVTRLKILPHYFELAMNRFAKYLKAEFLDQSLALAKTMEVQKLVLTSLDANGDGALSFEEVLIDDLLDLARKLSDRFFKNPPKDTVIAQDHHLERIVGWYMRQVRNNLHLQAGDEAESFHVSIDKMLGAVSLPSPNLSSHPRVIIEEGEDGVKIFHPPAGILIDITGAGYRCVQNPEAGLTGTTTCSGGRAEVTLNMHPSGSETDGTYVMRFHADDLHITSEGLRVHLRAGYNDHVGLLDFLIRPDGLHMRREDQGFVKEIATFGKNGVSFCVLTVCIGGSDFIRISPEGLLIDTNDLIFPGAIAGNFLTPDCVNHDQCLEITNAGKDTLLTLITPFTKVATRWKNITVYELEQH